MSNSIYWDKLRILVTNNCNYRCPFCHNEGQATRDIVRIMDYDSFKLLIDALKDEDVSEICFSGGEPFLDKKIIEMIKYVSNKTNWEVSCATNLSLITQQHLSQLVGIPLKFNIQFPYTNPKMFQQSTRNGNLDKVRTNIRMVKEAGLELGLNCVIQSNTVAHVEDMVDFALHEKLPLKLLPQIGLANSKDFKQFVFPILERYAISRLDKGTGAVRWVLEKNGFKTSVLYIDSPCFTHDIDKCRNYSEIRILPDMSLQACIQNPSAVTLLDLTKGQDSIKNQFREAWKNLKHC